MYSPPDTLGESLKIPKQVTLDKYGLSEGEWGELWCKHDGRCHVCGKPESEESTRAMHTDHEHVKGWKKMPPEERKLYIRGLLCYMCNRFRVTRGTTLESAMGLVRYLEDYENRL